MKTYKKDSATSYTLGMALTFYLLQHKPEIVTNVYISSSLKEGDAAEKLFESCRIHSISVTKNDKVFNILSPKENCYVIGEFTKYITGLESDKNHVVLVNPSNAGNLGTIIRSCVGFGINNIAVIRPAVDTFDPKVIRASMGAYFKTNIKYYNHWNEYEQEFPENHIYPFMLNQNNQSMLHDTEILDPFSLIFGNESSGLPEHFQNIGQSVMIKQSHDIDSLSLPMAVSIALYEIYR